MQKKRNSDVLKSMVSLKGKRVLDIGAGEGHLTRMMTRQGARVSGIECTQRQLDKAYAYENVGDEDFVDGVAQELPYDDGSIDVVVFFNSLHHVPVEDQFQALFEATRVLKTGGVIYISEPIAQGSHFELIKPIDDETKVRAKAYDCIKRHEELGLSWEAEDTYNHPVRRRSFDEFRDKLTGPNPERDQVFMDQDRELRQAFDKFGEKDDEGCMWFDQPTRVNLLKKVG